MELVTLKVKKDSLMHILYDSDSALVFDLFNLSLLQEILAVEKFHKDYYEDFDISQHKKMEKSRKLCFVFYTHSHPHQHLPKNGTHDVFPEAKIISGFMNGKCKDKQEIKFKNVTIKCLHTPCYTTDSFCYYVAMENKKYLFTGDTLFFLGCGKFLEGSAESMYDSIVKLIDNVDEDTECRYGHDYKEGNICITETMENVPDEIKNKSFLTMKEEIQYNEFVKATRIENKEFAVNKLYMLREIKNKYVLGNSISDRSARFE